MSLVSAFTQAVLPILAVMGAGYAIERLVGVAAEPLNTVALYVFLPALVFHSVATSTLGGGTVLRVFAGVAAFVAVLGVAGEVVGRLVGLGEPYRGASTLAASFPNAGFYGIPLAEFAFGAVGRTTAVLYIIAQTPLMYTLGVYVASRGGGLSGREAVREIFRLPLIYAVAAAGVVRWLGVVPPADGAAMRTISLVGDAAIPLMLLVVGIQLAGLGGVPVSGVATPTVLKLAVAPAVGALLALALGFGSVTVARVFVLLCATPAALTPLVLVLTYGDARGEGLSASEYLTTVIVLTTALSVPILTALIAVLRDGAFP